MMQGVTSLCPSSSCFLDEDSLVAFAKLFNINTDCLRCEIAIFHHLLKRKDKEDHPKGLLQMLSYMDMLKKAFSELHRIVLIACTLPVSSTECKINFSSMKLIKSELRSVMKQERPNSLMMLGIHREQGDNLDLDSVVDRFKAKFPKCMFFLCKLSITTLPKVLCFCEGHLCLNFLLYKLCLLISMICILFLLLEVYKLYWYPLIIFLR